MSCPTIYSFRWLVNLVKICNDLFSEGTSWNSEKFIFWKKVVDSGGKIKNPSGNTVIVLYNLILCPPFSTHTHFIQALKNILHLFRGKETWGKYFYLREYIRAVLQIIKLSLENFHVWLTLVKITGYRYPI